MHGVSPHVDAPIWDTGILKSSKLEAGSLDVYLVGIAFGVFEGEATGHHHRLVGQVQIYETAERQRILEVSSATATLVHEEHKPLEIESGLYAVVREREYNPFDWGTRGVMD